MKKRLLSLLLVLVMAVSLFSGLSMNASANDLIADWIENNDIVGQAVDKLYSGEPVYKGYCGDTSGDGSNEWKVLYEIYEVTNPNAMDNEYLQQIFDAVNYDPDQQYYGIWIYGNGAMADYDHITKESPWSGAITLTGGTHAGETVDMEELLIVAYIEGANGKNNCPGVTTVGEDAFWGQDLLTAVFLGNSVEKIKARAFESTELLAAINMPSNLNEIQKRAFYGCDKLTFLRASNTKITTIGERAFFGNTLLADVELPYTLKTIEPYAFAWCRILGEKNLVLPNGLTKIGEGAFAFCTHFSKLNVPTSVTTIGPYAFLGAYSLSKLTFTAGGTEITLAPEDLLIETVQKEGFQAESGGGVTVVLDTNLTPELLEEGFVRELISKIQTMRKDAGFEVMDTIKIYVSGNEKIQQIFESNRATITHDVLATDIIESAGGSYAKDWDINGEKVTLGVEKN